MNTEKILNYLRRRTAGDEEVAAADVIERQAAQIEMMRSTLQGIVGADWRKWEEPASPEEFVRWAKSRANHVLSTTPDQALEQFAAKVREERSGLPKPPKGYTAEELEKDNPFNQWMRED